ncbi:PilZ domain-containing protein [Alkalimarinus alittae]|uniref:PilZ domain-containing protein n=1 Tax=Alkalimarinus alittae TaxID=2961619 RepID=A0ABY6N500_9ALTE|nr:PilZ domain-containing protein [Alkalimarinus alittae]UZE97120.1 PilZ domain-containing protein [Alkalimarinus alittae]
MDTDSTKKNLRHYSRIKAQLQAKVLKDTDVLVNVDIANLSRAGMMLTCDNSTLNKLLPNTTPIVPSKPVQVAIEFTVPVVATQSVLVKTRCNIVYTRRLSRDSFQVGLEFDSVENNGYSYINQYIDAQQKAG